MNERHARWAARTRRDGQKRKEELQGQYAWIDYFNDQLQRRPSFNQLLRLNDDLDRQMKRVNKLADKNTLGQRVWLQKLRNLTTVAIMVLIFVQLFGVPHLRMQYRSRGSHDNIVAANYWSITGTQAGTMREGEQGFPIVALIPLDKPLWSLAGERIAALWAHEKEK